MWPLLEIHLVEGDDLRRATSPRRLVLVDDLRKVRMSLAAELVGSGGSGAEHGQLCQRALETIQSLLIREL